VGGKLLKKTIESGDFERSYWVFRSKPNLNHPDRRDPINPDLRDLPGPDNLTPLVIDLHDFNSCAEILSLYSGWLEIAASQNMVVVWPQGVETFGRVDGQLAKEVTSWAAKNIPYPATDEGIDDTSFLLKVIEDLQGNNELGINPDRLYMAGHGNGAFMAQQFAFEHPQLVAGVATHAGFLQALPDLKGDIADVLNFVNANSNVVFSPNSGPLYLKLVQKVPIVNIHATGDEIISYEDGVLSPGDGSSITQTIGAQPNHERWAVLNGLGALKPGYVKLPDNSTIQTFRATDDSVGVQFITVEGEFHDSIYTKLGSFVETTALAWDFLKSFTK